MLTGEKVLGINDASGMFSIDSNTNDYDKDSIITFNQVLKDNKINFKLE